MKGAKGKFHIVVMPRSALSGTRQKGRFALGREPFTILKTTAENAEITEHAEKKENSWFQSTVYKVFLFYKI
ncbi:MAG: hypothetical protein CVV03_10550 [Firmicutes bacterium HGW-Firmicutes-8]|nr:MAG: hypothetical protein CVV03_10550 [Firmicutes bacterium HGW-Firmicutes-8]